MSTTHPATRKIAKPLAMTTAALLTSAGFMVATPTPANAYDWNRTLRQGSTGSDVKELQIRVAGWAADSASRSYVAVDGVFGSGTKAAVIRFQKAYGLAADGIVGANTHKALNALEDSDGTRHFNYSEFHSKDGSGFSGGKVSSSTVRENVRRMMYKLEAVRRKAGNNAIRINSGFRSVSHNSNVGGASNSQHMYGIAADIVISNRSVSNTISYAKTSGYSGIIRYSTFTHVDSRAEYGYGSSGFYWNT